MFLTNVNLPLQNKPQNLFGRTTDVSFVVCSVDPSKQKEGKNTILLYQLSSLNGTLIEVYEGSRTSDKSSFLNAIECKFKAMSQISISDDF